MEDTVPAPILTGHEGTSPEGLTLRRIIETVQDIIYVVAGEEPYAGRVELVSYHVLDATGWTAEDFARDKDLWFSLIHPEDIPGLMESTTRMMSLRVPVVRTYRLRRRDGAWRWFEDRVAPVIDRSGRMLGFCGAARDVTDAREAQAHAVLTDRLASLGILSAGIAHELNNLMGTLHLALAETKRTLVQAPPSGTSTEAEALSLLEMACDAETRMKTIVAELSGVSRDDGLCADLDPRDSVDRAIRLVTPSLDSVRLVCQYAEVPKVSANEVRLTQVFMNLILNAVHASMNSASAEKEVRVVTSAQAGRAVIEIQDDGIGIAPDVLPRIFEPFFTSKPAGMGKGLGLFVSHKIVSELGGTIEVQTSPNQGSTFRVVLPAAKPKG